MKRFLKNLFHFFHDYEVVSQTPYMTFMVCVDCGKRKCKMKPVVEEMKVFLGEIQRLWLAGVISLPEYMNDQESDSVKYRFIELDGFFDDLESLAESSAKACEYINDHAVYLSYLSDKPFAELDGFLASCKQYAQSKPELTLVKNNCTS